MTNVQLVELTENTLGWALEPPKHRANVPLYRLRIVEASKLKRKRATKPYLYTEQNFLLALEYCRREHISVGPLGVLSYIERALEEANKPETFIDVEDAISQALMYEKEQKLPGHSQWIVRLTRASGPDARQAVYQEWKRERGR